MTVTQKQIARHLGLSQPLVAQALNGHPHVAERTRQRVLDAARELGYTAHTNAAARSLVARRHGQKVRLGQIAVLMGADMDGLALQDMPFFREILQGIHSEAAKSNLDVAIHILRPGNLPRAVTSGGVDGAICVYSRTISQDLEEQAPEVPAVRLSGYFPRFWGIYPDDSRGIYGMTRHLLELGHRRIAYLGCWLRYSQDVAQQRRFEAFKMALAEFGLEADPGIISGDVDSPSVSKGREWMGRMLERRRDFTAVVCAHDPVALGAIEAAEEAGLSVPGDLSVTGFDGVDSAGGYGASNSLSTVFFDRRIMGRRAMEMLDSIWNGEETGPRHEILPVRLLLRQTTAAPVSQSVFGTLQS